MCAVAEISRTSRAKLGKNKKISTDSSITICQALNCDIGNIMGVKSDNE